MIVVKIRPTKCALLAKFSSSRRLPPWHRILQSEGSVAGGREWFLAHRQARKRQLARFSGRALEFRLTQDQYLRYRRNARRNSSPSAMAMMPSNHRNPKSRSEMI